MNKSWYKTKTTWDKLVLNRNGYDPFIDFLKGVCIIFVIINHCMPETIMDYSGFLFWGVSAVPIFLIIQVFHAYKKGHNSSSINTKKIWNKIAKPFFICEIIICLSFIFKLHHTQLSDILSDIINWIKAGGYGPGAYYPWIYLQFAILLPLISPIFKISNPFLCLFFVIISQSIETACSYYNMPQLAYRLLFLRYIFIIYLGYQLATNGFLLNIYSFCIAIICLLISAIIVYGDITISPYLYVFVNPVCHWFCYIYISYLLLFLIKYIHAQIHNGLFLSYLLNSGKYSYEIFLFQIMYFGIADNFILEILEKNISNYVLYSIIRTSFPVLICTLPVILYKKKRNKSTSI